MGEAVDFVIFQMADVIVLDRTLRPRVFDEQNWKSITPVWLQFRFGDSSVNQNKFSKNMIRRHQILVEQVNRRFYPRGGYLIVGLPSQQITIATPQQCRERITLIAANSTNAKKRPSHLMISLSSLPISRNLEFRVGI
jgi:hypothetical protein